MVGCCCRSSMLYMDGWMDEKMCEKTNVIRNPNISRRNVWKKSHSIIDDIILLFLFFLSSVDTIKKNEEKQRKCLHIAKSE